MFWEDPGKAKIILKERSIRTCTIEHWHSLYGDVEECEVLFYLATEESDEKYVEEARNLSEKLEKKIKSVTVELMLNGEDDKNNAIMSINAGAGGTESQDWAVMLFWMYSQWTTHKGLRLNIIVVQAGGKSGTRGVNFAVVGFQA